MFFTLSVLSTIGNIILFLFVLGLVICIHELGHFYFARRAGILCHEFSFGMGPRIWSRKKGETAFSIRAIPFGGFVSMAGEEIDSEVLKKGMEIRIGFNDKSQINKIILDHENDLYKEYELIKVETWDLLSEEGNRLYINEHTVERTAMYVLAKEEEMQIAPKDRSFAYKTKWQRFITTFGGPMMNFLLALVIFFVASLIAGVADPDSTIVSGVSEETPASLVFEPGDEIIEINGMSVETWVGESNSVQSGLSNVEGTYEITVIRDGQTIVLEEIRPQFFFYGLGFASDYTTDDLVIGKPLYRTTELEEGDRILEIAGEDTTDWTWGDMATFAMSYTNGSTEDSPTIIKIERNGEILTFEYVAYGEDVIDSMGASLFFTRIGIDGSSKFSIFGSVANGWNEFLAAAGTIFKTLGVLFSSSQVGVSDLSGVVGMFSVTSEAAAAGLVSLLSWVGLLSVNLGILNLLPLPALDGGRLVFITVEAITGKKPNPKFENTLHNIMFILLMGLMIYITFNDIVKLIIG